MQIYVSSLKRHAKKTKQKNTPPPPPPTKKKKKKKKNDFLRTGHCRVVKHFFFLHTRQGFPQFSPVLKTAHPTRINKDKQVAQEGNSRSNEEQLAYGMVYI